MSYLCQETIIVHRQPLSVELIISTITKEMMDPCRRTSPALTALIIIITYLNFLPMDAQSSRNIFLPGTQMNPGQTYVIDSDMDLSALYRS